jgi:hypothetical protein
LVSIAAESQHGTYTRQPPGTTTPFHAVHYQLVDIAFNGSQAGFEGTGPVFQVQQSILVVENVLVELEQQLASSAFCLLDVLFQLRGDHFKALLP